jgi:diguanylate cyclase (GGDEF)-like protein
MATTERYYCGKYGYGPERIRERLRVVGLHPGDQALAERLQREVIGPHVGRIVESFYDFLERQPDFNRILAKGYSLAHLKETQRRYLLSLGLGYDRPVYFEERLRIGHAHVRAGVPLSLYQAAYSRLQRLIIGCYPAAIAADRALAERLTAFLIAITALDMSLAIETYHLTQVQDLKESLDTLRDETRELHQRVDTDPLTQLASRDHALAVLRKALGKAHAARLPLFLAMADLDLFKIVNDTHGHLVGDSVLRGVAARIQSAVRDVDTVGRYGGEEFVIILDRTSAATARKIAERVRRRVAAEPINVSGREFRMTLSLGLARARAGDTIESLIARADAALYRAKEAGRNCVILEDAAAEAGAAPGRLESHGP